MDLGPEELYEITARTLDHYQRRAQPFWEGTRDHDVSQNLAAFLSQLQGEAPFNVLDFGCGPGRDVAALMALGQHPTGIDGCELFCEMARALTGREIWHQNFLELDLPPSTFDGIFANASMFHIPQQELPRVLGQLRGTLKPGGVLFASNPRGTDQEGWTGERYGVYMSLNRWRAVVEAAGFRLLHHYYRPAGEPRELQPWLATVWRTSAD